ncbi:OmpA family protein [Fusobacterium hwasookii]|uniref:OmpA family protein n=1 Tax=Fusobacterium hwasookii TaxID=1583098 RepID=UPI0028E61604|nr:OmpA family protein [Fusobacterium hwasookii]
MVKRATIGLFLFMLSLSSFALTRESVRRDTLRINALELKEINITSAEEKPKQITIVLDERAVHFGFNKSEVGPEFNDLLSNLKEFVEENDYVVTIVGHTDSTGSNKYNFGLSERRAESAKKRLLELGLSSERILGIEAKGEEEPIATNETKEGRAQNRRVEFKLDKIEK